MKYFQIIFIFLLLSCSFPRQLNANTIDNDSIRISLLTCSPGNAIYSLFGHTAIRYEQPEQNIDAVFNYGLFSFNTPNFILRFALGETYYLLGVQSYESFKNEYEYYGREVRQQTLNLSNEEKRELIDLLKTNSLPENRTYHYNFFYDNCATRPRDKIEESIKGDIIYPNLNNDGKATSFRQLIHQYTKNNPWSRFGIDLCVGSDADKPITNRQMMFIPFYLEEAYSKAEIVNNTDKKMLAQPSVVIVDDSEPAEEEPVIARIGSFITPLRASLLLFIIIASLTLYGIKNKKGLWGIDLILFPIAGIVGCVLAFLALFSQHPAVSSNYLLLVFHPGQLLFIPFIIHDIRKGKRSWYMMFNAAVLTLFIVLFPLIPQRFDFAVVPLALCLLIRSLSNLILTYKMKK